MTQAERYKSMRKWHEACDDSHCRCHVFNLGKVPTVGDFVLIDGYLGVPDPVCCYAVVTSDAAYTTDREDGAIDSFVVKVTSVVTGSFFKLEEQLTLDKDNMCGATWKLLNVLDRLAAV
jgi:hypothetical protein